MADFNWSSPEAGNLIAMMLGGASKLFNQKGSNVDALANMAIQFAGAQQKAGQLAAAMQSIGAMPSTQAAGTQPTAPTAQKGAETAPPTTAPTQPTQPGQVAPTAGFVQPQSGQGSQSAIVQALLGALGGAQASPFSWLQKY